MKTLSEITTAVHYVSPHNDPLSADSCEWYKTMVGVADRVDTNIEG